MNSQPLSSTESGHTTVGTRFIASGDSSPCSGMNVFLRHISKDRFFGVGTSFSASAIYRLLSVHHERVMHDEEEAINRGRAEAGPYLGCMIDKNSVGERGGINAGSKQVQMPHGDESPDPIYRVPTGIKQPDAEVSDALKQVHMVEIRDLKKSFVLKPVLRGINLDVRQGECVALLGANGTGKTTLLRIMAGLMKPGTGTVSIAGFDSVRDAQQVRGLIGLVAHQPYLYEELTALENLLFFARMYAVKHAQERAHSLLQRVGLERRMRERVTTFSRGQVQRLAWARALLHSPRVLLLDEPDTGLDQQGHELIDALLNEHRLQGGCTLFTTHQLERALRLADRVVILSVGRIVFERETTKLDPDILQNIYRRRTQ